MLSRDTKKLENRVELCSSFFQNNPRRAYYWKAMELGENGMPRNQDLMPADLSFAYYFWEVLLIISGYS